MPDTVAAGTRTYLEWGYIQIEKNEVAIVSTVPDPPKVKLFAVDGISLGAWSFGRIRDDGTFEEMVLLQGKQDERTRSDPQHFSGELTMHIRNGSIAGDAGMVKVLEMRHDSIWIKGISLGTGLNNDPIVTPPPTPPPVPPVLQGDYPPGTEGIAPGNFAALRLVYDVDLEDEEGDYYAGRMPWVGPRTGFSVLWMAFRKAIPTEPDPNDP